jgi:outer membrane protein OmpA-like peptidoglycan-associated protein
VTDGEYGSVFFLQKPLQAVGYDPLQTVYNYAKSDIVASVFFDFDKSVVKSEDFAKIEAAAKFFLKNDTLRILLVGHCDHFGTFAYNNSLGQRRAESVKAKMMVELGLSEDRIIVASVGSEKAVEASRNKDVTVVDRRVDVVPLKSAERAASRE